MPRKLQVYAMMMSVFSLSAPALAQSPFTARPATPVLSAHVHGVAHLAMAVDGQTLVMELEMPLANLVGFEHKPANDLEEKAFSRASQTMAQADKLFEWNAAAHCTVTSVEIEMPTFEHGGHEDVDARYQYICQSAAELQSLEVKLFNIFDHVVTLKATYLDEETQVAKTLTPADPIFSLR